MPAHSTRPIKTKSKQRTIFDPDFVLRDRPFPPESFPARFRHVCEAVIPDEVFTPLYTGFGRPPLSPSALMRLHLLMLRDHCGDAAALENLLYDERYRYMCNLPLPACDIHPTTLHYFRVRLIFGTIKREEIARLKAEGITVRTMPVYAIFEATKRAAVALGLLDPEAAQYLDSTYILGAAAVQDTFALLFHGMRQAMAAIQQAVESESYQALLAGLRRTEYTMGVAKPAIEWRDAEARSRLLGDLVQDLITVLVASDGLTDPAVTAACAQLKRLVEQDVEVSEEGRVQIRQGVAPGRQCSTVDPEMRHGRKSSSKRFNGYKAHLAMEPSHGMITAVTTTDGSVHDGQATMDLLEQTAPAVLGGDNAYAGAELRADALARGTVLLTPTAPAQPFEKDQFVYDEEQYSLTCPAGETAKIGKKQQAHFSARLCRACPYGADCNPNGKGRTITVSPHEALQRNLREAARSDAWQDFLRMRCTIEHTMARFIRWTGRKGRYFGKLKTGLQMLLGSIGYNLEKLGHAYAQQAVCAGPTGC